MSQARSITNGPLDGLGGIVYVMFLHRKIHAASIAPLLWPSVTKHKESVYQTKDRLLKDDYLRELKKKSHEKGQPQILTAEESHVFSTIRSGGVELTATQERVLRLLMEYFSPATEKFPEFLRLNRSLFANGARLDVKKLQWRSQTLPHYLMFLVMILTKAYEAEHGGLPSQVVSELERAVSDGTGAPRADLEKLNELFYEYVEKVPQDSRRAALQEFESARAQEADFFEVLRSLPYKLMGGMHFYKLIMQVGIENVKGTTRVQTSSRCPNCGAMIPSKPLPELGSLWCLTCGRKLE